MISVDELSKKVNNLCLKYIESLVWTTHYYFSQCISQEWYYPYEYSPTLHDVKIFLHKQKKVKIQLNTTPYTPIEQLRYVFPKQSYHLCDELEQVDGNDFITKIDKEYTLLKRYDWECHPIV